VSEYCGRPAARFARHVTRARGTPSVVAVGYFGSYARGDWGVGSDLDLVVIFEASAEPFERRAVPMDLLVYTRAEWTRLASRPRDVVWLVGAN
jgi:predicted nucleotidyltransferase